MTDIEPTEQHRYVYIPLVDEGTSPTVEKDRAMTWYNYLGKSIPNLGTVTLCLGEVNTEYPDNGYLDEKVKRYENEAMILNADGVITKTTEQEAISKGLVHLTLDIKHPVARIRGVTSFTALSIDGTNDILKGRLVNFTEDEEKVRENSGKDPDTTALDGTNMNTCFWLHGTDNKPMMLFMENDSSLVSKLKFRFESKSRR